MDITQKLLLSLGIALAAAVIDGWLSSKYKRMNPYGKFNPSFKNNFVRAIPRYILIVRDFHDRKSFR